MPSKPHDNRFGDCMDGLYSGKLSRTACKETCHTMIEALELGLKDQEEAYDNLSKGTPTEGLDAVTETIFDLRQGFLDRLKVLTENSD